MIKDYENNTKVKLPLRFEKNKIKRCLCRAWWRTLVIPVLGRLRPEDRRFAASLSYLVRPSAT